MASTIPIAGPAALIEPSPANIEIDPSLHFLEGGGEVGARMRRARLGVHAAGARSLWPQSLKTIVRVHARFALRDVDAVGTGAHVLLQRRLSADRRHQARLGARRARRQGVGGDLARHRAAHRARPAARRSDLGRGAAAVPRAQRLSRGDLPHVLVQSGVRRREPHRRHAVRRHRSDRARDRRTAAARAARPRGALGRRRQRRGDAASRRCDVLARYPLDVPFAALYLTATNARAGAPRRIALARRCVAAAR